MVNTYQMLKNLKEALEAFDKSAVQKLEFSERYLGSHDICEVVIKRLGEIMDEYPEMDRILNDD